MSSGKTAPAAEGEESTPKKKGKMKLILGAVVLLVAICTALWFSGVLPKILGGKKGTGDKGPPKLTEVAPPATYLDVPEILTNLNVPGRRQSYIKLKAKLELGGAADVAPVTAAMPRILDLFQTYLRDMRPEELRSSEGSYRLREELVSRAAVAAAPAQVRGVLFQEMVIQ